LASGHNHIEDRHCVDLPGIQRGCADSQRGNTRTCAHQWLFLAKFGAHDAARYAAFLQNALMSGLFVQMI
jgi:hypothetical protein